MHTLLGKPEGKRQFPRPGYRWKGYIKMVLKGMGSEGVDWVVRLKMGSIGVFYRTR